MVIEATRYITLKPCDLEQINVLRHVGGLVGLRPTIVTGADDLNKQFDATRGAALQSAREAGANRLGYPSNYRQACYAAEQLLKNGGAIVRFHLSHPNHWISLANIQATYLPQESTVANHLIDQPYSA